MENELKLGNSHAISSPLLHDFCVVFLLSLNDEHICQNVKPRYLFCKQEETPALQLSPP